ncbi:MAG: hypothetical protein M1826_000963 [Phylliscum demangeonii]|nr:MAG: hypothetical protein M1826_000963 [Phylliscum demangeonii]
MNCPCSTIRPDRSDSDYYSASFGTAQRLSTTAWEAYKPAQRAYYDRLNIQLALAKKQQEHIQITPEEIKEWIAAVDQFRSITRLYRDAMDKYMTWLLKREGINNIVRAEGKDSEVDFLPPDEPSLPVPTDAEKAHFQASMKAIELKRASCIKQHCKILHTGECKADSHGVDEGQFDFFSYIPAPLRVPWWSPWWPLKR